MKGSGSWIVERGTGVRLSSSHDLQSTTRHPSGEAGFAMLLVFAMAAAVAIVLYTELPRAAFEAQRHREQLLIDRGEQYQRAIQLYFRKTRQFPANLEQLENTNNYRFLRRRYKDPITGKDEWRLIHIGPGGMLTDSLTQQPPGQKKDKDEKAEGSGEEGKPGAGAGELPSAATRRRASEMGGPGLPGSAPPAGVLEPGAPPPPGQEGQSAQLQQYPAYPPAQPGQPYPPQTFPPEPNPEPQVGEPYVVPGQRVAQPGQPQPYPVPSMQPGQAYPVIQPGQVYPSMQPGQVYPVIQPGQTYPGMQPVPSYPQPFPPQSPVRIQVGQPGQTPPGFIQGLLTPGRPGAYPGGVPSQRVPTSSQAGAEFSSPYSQTAQPPAGGGAANPALEMIRKLLTTPRPGGLGQSQGQQPFTYGAGIAGVASKAEADSIILYNDRSRYNEWEFIYDLRKDRTMIGPAAITGAQPGTLLQPAQGSPSTIPATGQGGRGR